MPFLSVNILGKLKAATNDVQDSPQICKTASLTHVFLGELTTIRHTYADDIESLFYVLIWIMVLYDGPLGHEREDISHEKTMLGLWSEESAHNLLNARNAEFTFLVHPHEDELAREVSPYFKDLLPLANSWRLLLGRSLLEGIPVKFADVMGVLDDFLKDMPNEKPPEMTNTFQHFIAQHRMLTSKFPPHLDNADMNSTLPTTSNKRLCDDVRSMDNPPVPNKRFKAM